MVRVLQEVREDVEKDKQRIKEAHPLNQAGMNYVKCMTFVWGSSSDRPSSIESEIRMCMTFVLDALHLRVGLLLYGMATHTFITFCNVALPGMFCACFVKPQASCLLCFAYSKFPFPSKQKKEKKLLK